MSRAGRPRQTEAGSESLHGHAHDRLPHLAALGIVEGVVDFLEGVEGHKLVERETALAMQLDHLRYEHIGSGVSLDDAAQSLADRKSTRLNSSHRCISYAVFCLKKKK